MSMASDTSAVFLRQFEAGLCMIGDCVEKCPEEHWEGMIGRWPFWLVAYHVLCFADL